jgi:membrane-associated protein
MEYINFLIHFILHLDTELPLLVANYHNWTYLILFIIIFCETGLVVTPFLPGDSLLFAAGALAATGSLSIVPLMAIIFVAAIIGDNTNYSIGNFLGHKIYERNFKLVRRDYIDKTHVFYEKHGGKALIIARFMPIFRTFAPFVAGIGTMKYLRFLFFCLVGNTLWVTSFCLAGYFFGQLPFVKENFTIVVFAIIGISLIGPVFTFLKHWIQNRKKTE